MVSNKEYSFGDMAKDLEPNAASEEDEPPAEHSRFIFIGIHISYGSPLPFFWVSFFRLIVFGIILYAHL